jgi:hypothetical protein
MNRENDGDFAPPKQQKNNRQAKGTKRNQKPTAKPMHHHGQTQDEECEDYFDEEQFEEAEVKWDFADLGPGNQYPDPPPPKASQRKLSMFNMSATARGMKKKRQAKSQKTPK